MIISGLSFGEEMKNIRLYVYKGNKNKGGEGISPNGNWKFCWGEFFYLVMTT